MKFENLDVWKRSATLAIAIFQHFKSSREYCLENAERTTSVTVASVTEGLDDIRMIEFQVVK